LNLFAQWREVKKTRYIDHHGYRLSHAISPSTTATIVVAISRVRRLKRQLNQWAKRQLPCFLKLDQEFECVLMVLVFGISGDLLSIGQAAVDVGQDAG
jgi:hypothetical protein